MTNVVNYGSQFLADYNCAINIENYSRVLSVANYSSVIKYRRSVSVDLFCFVGANFEGVMLF